MEIDLRKFPEHITIDKNTFINTLILMANLRNLTPLVQRYIPTILLPEVAKALDLIEVWHKIMDENVSEMAKQEAGGLFKNIGIDLNKKE